MAYATKSGCPAAGGESLIETVLLALHIAGGAVLLVAGPLNMFIPKRRGPHTRIGEVYHWLYVVVAGSALVLALLNWSESWFFVPITLFSYAFALTGYLAVKLRPHNWLGPAGGAGRSSRRLGSSAPSNLDHEPSHDGEAHQTWQVEGKGGVCVAAE